MKRIATLQLNVLGLVSVNNAGFDYDLLPAQQVLPSPPPVLKRRRKRHYNTRLQTQVTYFINRSPSRSFFALKCLKIRHRLRSPVPLRLPRLPLSLSALLVPLSHFKALALSNGRDDRRGGPLSYPKPDFFVK